MVLRLRIGLETGTGTIEACYSCRSGCRAVMLTSCAGWDADQDEQARNALYNRILRENGLVIFAPVELPVELSSTRLQPNVRGGGFIFCREELDGEVTPDGFAAQDGLLFCQERRQDPVNRRLWGRALKSAEAFLRQVLGHEYTLYNPVIISNTLVAPPQQWHTDYSPEQMSVAHPPYGVIFAAEDGVTLQVWLHNAEQPETLSIPRGSLVLFHGDLVHAGSGGANGARVHMYLATARLTSTSPTFVERCADGKWRCE